MRSFLFFALLALSGLFLISCSGNKNSTNPNPTPVQTIGPKCPYITGGIEMLNGSTQATLMTFCIDDAAVTDAAMTLTGPSGLAQPLTYNSTYGSAGSYVTWYYSGTSWTYIPNQPYTMTVIYNGTTYQASVTSVGSVTFNHGPAGVTVTWVGGGNQNTCYATQTSGGTNSYSWGNQGFSYTGNIASPFYIAQSTLAGYTGGNYSLRLQTTNYNYNGFETAGGYYASFFGARDDETVAY